MQRGMLADSRVMSLKRQLGPVAASRALNVYYRGRATEDGPAQGQFFCRQSDNVKRTRLLGQFGRVG